VSVICKFLQILTQGPMAKARKTKRDNRIVTYVRVQPEEHARITQIAEERGLPHTIASVAAEMITRGLKTEATAVPEGRS
jgi:hypothetical protein